jgi:hypothetical protein
MKITVTPICQHLDGFHDAGEPYVGQRAIITREGVWLDEEPVVVRDRRIKRNREPGHPWFADGAPRTGFRVEVEP